MCVRVQHLYCRSRTRNLNLTFPNKVQKVNHHKVGQNFLGITTVLSPPPFPSKAIVVTLPSVSTSPYSFFHDFEIWDDLYRIPGRVIPSVGTARIISLLARLITVILLASFFSMAMTSEYPRAVPWPLS